MNKLEGKTVLITGGASGIGAATALAFLQQGAKLVLADRDETKLLATCADLKEETGGEVFPVVADVSKEEDNRRIVESVMSNFGGLHMSFINAGVVVWGTLMEVDEKQIDDTFGPNFKSVVFGLKHQLPAISKTWDKGSVVVTSSTASSRVFSSAPAAVIYACSKAAVDLMVKYGAIEGAPLNVRVNGIAPGTTKTPMMMTLGEEVVKSSWENNHLGGKRIYAKDIAPLVLFLTSEEAHVITGAIYSIDAGTLIRT